MGTSPENEFAILSRKRDREKTALRAVFLQRRASSCRPKAIAPERSEAVGDYEFIAPSNQLWAKIARFQALVLGFS